MPWHSCTTRVTRSCSVLYREQAVGLCSKMVCVAGLLSPLLSVYHYSIPIVVFSSVTLVGGSLAFLLPETQGRELVDSTAQAEVQR